VSDLEFTGAMIPDFKREYSSRWFLSHTIEILAGRAFCCLSM
jgi:hypothetical protein